MGDETTGIRRESAGVMVFDTAGAARMTINNSDPAHVQIQDGGTFSIGSSTSGGNLKVYGCGSSTFMCFGGCCCSGAGQLILSDATRLTFGSGSDADMYYDGTDFYFNPRVVGSGNFVISGPATCVIMDGASAKFGIGTAAPAASLHVYCCHATNITTIKIDNSCDGAAAASAELFVSTCCTGGDPTVRFSNRTTNWIMGMDNNAATGATRPLKISENTTLGTNDYFVIESGGNVAIAAAKKLYLDGTGGHTYITETSNDQLDIYTGGVQSLTIDSNQDVQIQNGWLSIPATQKLYFDGAANTSIRESGADIMTFETGGSDRMCIDASGDAYFLGGYICHRR